MITFRDLTLTNFRNHKKSVIRLNPGVTGIIGDNGSGKSSVIEAFQFLITGEPFEGSKADVINLDASSGSVSGSFDLNGKRGWLERHLDMTKVILKYDGKTYNKATEVKDLWDKLLQLNPDIIKKVIIARQGEIKGLVAGPQSEREKVFQKIFLVPPTDRIRNVLWKDYLNQAPPPVPEEDLLALRASQEHLQANVDTLRGELSRPMYTEQQIDEMKQRVIFLTRCIDDSSRVAILHELLENQKEELHSTSGKMSGIREKMAPIAIDKYRTYQNTLNQQQGLFQRKQQLEKQLVEIKKQYPYSEEEQISYRSKISNLIEDLDNAKLEISVCKGNVERLEKQVLALENTDAKCPVCLQEIHDIDKLSEDIRQQIYQQTDNMTRHRVNKDRWEEDLQDYQGMERGYNRIATEENQLRAQLQQFRDLTFDQTTFDNIGKVITKYEQLSAEYENLRFHLKDLDSKTKDTENEIHRLAVYDGDSTPDQEREKLYVQLTDNVERTREWQQKNIALQLKEGEMDQLVNRIKNTEENQEKNKRRNLYITTLQKVYDVLHTSQFPRKLVLSYADVVTGYLQENLSMFNIPYTARVADNFKIELLDEQERPLPKISGGQEIIVGLGLHLALHDMFIRDFPIMIIDEGTTHLDKHNREAYFKVIKELKRRNKVKQIFIIDHDAQLSNVVDHVIQLERDKQDENNTIITQ